MPDFKKDHQNVQNSQTSILVGRFACFDDVCAVLYGQLGLQQE
jgi:hypothetical protein